MGQQLNQRIEDWKKRLLDLSKRNVLINFKEAKRSNLKITSPSLEEMFKALVLEEKIFKFPYAQKIESDINGDELPVDEHKGDIETNRTLTDLRKTLKAIRAKAKLMQEEQGVNILYVTFGSLTWKENESSDNTLTSPLILVPVRLQLDSLTSPYTLSLGDDDIVVNPTLSHCLENEFGIDLPNFNGENISDYLLNVASTVNNKGWTINEDVHLALLSFLKINMYKDLENNLDKISSSQVLSAIAQEGTIQADLSDLADFDHDNKTRPIDIFQVVDADSSQQDAILLSKKGASFVLQGPPGTGKSQTITNIIAEALADGKKVLFVSEKMAAIQVVANRLEAAGLSEFCLTLHNHKVSKKTILDNLADCLQINRRKVPQSTLDHLRELEDSRKKLNDYKDQLHTTWSALNATIFEINGELAKLDHAPNLIFPIQAPEAVTRDGLGDRKSVLKELERTLDKKTEDYRTNVWRGVTIERLTNELRHDIHSKINGLVPIIQKVATIYDECSNTLHLDLGGRLEDIENLLSILSIARETPSFISEWIESDIDRLIAQCDEFAEKYATLQALSEDISREYASDIWRINAAKCKESVAATMTILRESVRLPEVFDIPQIKQSTAALESLRARISKARDLYLEIAAILPSLGKTPTFGRLHQVIRLAHILNACDAIPESWCDYDEIISAIQQIDVTEKLHKDLTAKRDAILKSFDKEVFEIDYYTLLKKFRADYKSSLTRIFSSDYRKDLGSIQQYVNNGSKLNYESAHALLQQLKEHSDLQERVKSQSRLWFNAYGELYNDQDTDWEQLRKVILSFRDIFQLFPNKVLPQDFKEGISEKTLPLDAFVKMLNHYDESIPKALDEISVRNFDRNDSLEDILSYIDAAISASSRLKSACEGISVHRKTQAALFTVLSDLDNLATAQELRQCISAAQNSLKANFRTRFNEAGTDWNALRSSLLYASKLKDSSLSSDFTKETYNYLGCNDDAARYCSQQEDTLSSCNEALRPYLEWFFNLFESAEPFANLTLGELAGKLIACRDNMDQLEQWVDFCSARKKCASLGMEAFVDEVENNNISAADVTDAYLKRFYRLWLDKAHDEFPAVREFRGDNHNVTIKEFCSEDKFQLEIARARIREKLYNSRPDFYSFSSADDETAILRHELGKSRRIMPLRKLFRSIPNLLPVLKPCFMMSPLSVSVFLEAQSYTFDMVIFDEASQVHTEDAVGAIMRGKQIIIVGDTKQLPPTNFFSAALDDSADDYDSEQESTDAGSYQSILEEAATVLPDRTLRWHYRSRHEDLITFSNIKIYGNQLITFPSSEERGPGVGVEYIYVPDGVYDGGNAGKKNNIIEAEKVAELVFRHFRDYPHRSLGVVAFSASQQSAIESAIDRMRRKDLRCEHFFSESAEEPFFIKNLETVQGDERDTIIFSIGYGKDDKGIMRMNFGPLNKEGGYRRLNVAVTRAKYNVKLVGSIQPTDIDTERTSSEGVRLLRSYIEFAQQGISALRNELTYGAANFDSPFEESVYDFLSAKGYGVATQIGCSGFRIDMAVKDPMRKGHFALGIECDGATYHSSRTARERDRLRQTILEDMGWTIYRIWSTDWIKNTATEKQKLISAVEAALSHTRPEPIIEEAPQPVLEVITEPVEESVSDEATLFWTPSQYGFIPYERADLAAICSKYPGDETNIIRSVIEFEQPVHFNDLCGRVAPIYGNQKVTVKITQNVRYILDARLKTKIQEQDGFISMTGMSEVQVRIPSEADSYIRPIDFISKLEIWAAMCSIISGSIGITSESLMTATVREFGFKRTGGKISDRLDEAYSDMLALGIVEEIDGKPALTDKAKQMFKKQ